jgi:hypothetical protein
VYYRKLIEKMNNDKKAFEPVMWYEGELKMATAISTELLKNIVVDVANKVLPLSKGRKVEEVLFEMQEIVNQQITVEFTETEGWNVELLPPTYDGKGIVASINFRIHHDYKSGKDVIPFSIKLI